MKPGQTICPLCKDSVDKLVYRFHYDSERVVIDKIRAEFPEWTKDDGLCSRCLDFFHSEIVMEQRILPSIGPHFPIRTADDFIVIPTGLRMNADPRFTGKGITICFIDSGFYPHADLTATKNRIKKIVDIPNLSESSKVLSFGEDLGEVGPSWHGTMTSVVCAGDGYLSRGLYRGIASDAELVLLKVQDKKGRITTENIVKALEWILENHEEYGIRILNISLGSDEIVSYKQSKIDKLAEQAIEKGIVIVAAVGNDANAAIKPPANSLNVIAVGGVDDNNILDQTFSKVYHSSYGKTIDELMKPELVAHAIWIAAPILPGTVTQKEAEALYYLTGINDEQLIPELKNFSSAIELHDSICESDNIELVREKMLQHIRNCKYISPHYMHVDGTSFAAPIVSSIIAQLLEINPDLTPAGIREILFSTAKRINDVASEQQGFGLVQPRKAVLKILKRETITKPNLSPHVNQDKKTIGFYVRHDCASQISLSGSFNHWAQDELLMEPGKNGLWQLEIPILTAGRYHYKFFVDNKTWIEDFDNPYREPDGFNGFNSILIIEPN
ncbi:MAG TPA: S8 family serine peptidase [Chitinophagaceae bacterium]|jgi:serine protease AprX|nr:S8 family serine peptidase [Chitinophagaceae bacterium]